MAIKSFKHKGLKRFFYDDNPSGIQSDHLKKVGYILDAIDSSHHPKIWKPFIIVSFQKKRVQVKVFSVLKLMVIGESRFK